MGMKILGVPLTGFILAFVITLVLTGAIFYPALANFGEVLFGWEDMHLFLWLFWHYEHSLENGTNPLFAEEIFYPYGLSLAMSTITPLQGALYLFLPDGWGAFGKITFLQVLSFVIGGIFSFCLVYKFTRSFLPSLLGSVIYNFSAFHLEKMLHHLNYSMGMAFLPLFFLFYYQTLENTSRRNILLLSISLLLLGLCEMTLVIMAGFIVMLDIFSRYMNYSHRKIFTPKNTLVLGMSVLISLVSFEFLELVGSPKIIAFTLPSLLFILPLAFVVLGKKNLEAAEAKHKYFQAMVLAAIPILIWLAFLALQPTYDFKDSVLLNIFGSSLIVSHVEYLFLPSEFQAFSAFLPWDELPFGYGTALYLNPVGLALFLFSYLLAGATGEEKRFRNYTLLMVLFSFPLVLLWGQLVLITPFIVETLFPLLPVLRVAARFMVFTLLFFSLVAALVSKRILLSWKNSGKTVLIVLILLALVFLWPSLEQFEFDYSVPNFYLELSKSSENQTLFIYPYHTYLLHEVYYQTIHHKKMSVGYPSRFPSEENDLFALYPPAWFSDETLEEISQESIKIIKKYEYDYVVVPTLSDCVETEFISPTGQEKLRGDMEAEFGKPVYEDESRVIYANPKKQNS